MIKAAFFDIDGTLVSLKTKVYPPSTVEAIARLRAKGVKCFVATGRSKFEINGEKLLDGIEFDGYLTNNGQDAYAPDGTLLYGKPIDTADAAAVLDWVERGNHACWMVNAEQGILNHLTPRVVQAFEDIHTAPPTFGDLRAMLDTPIYKIVLFLTPEEIPQVLSLIPNSRFSRWHPMGHDIISRDGGKRAAMLEIIEGYGITAEECIAFGDSHNDLEMLEAAGIGVAMGNGTKEAKEIADYVTDDCDEDGILKALLHFELI